MLRIYKIIKRIQQLPQYLAHIWLRFKRYILRLLFPLYLFPIKLITYSLYYVVVFVFKLIFSLIKIIFETIIYPFRSLKNFLKSLIIVGAGVYMVASLFVIMDYLRTHYGYYGKFLCAVGTQNKIKGSVVRIVGGYSEGSGFFINDHQVLTNFHVIENEPSPKIILPNGSFITPIKITGNSAADLAVLNTQERYPDLVMPLPDRYEMRNDEPLLSSGYPLGTAITGKATVLKGSFIDWRKSKRDVVPYIQTSISIVQGMSGGPLTDICGNVVGINTMGIAGLSMFISADYAKNLVPTMTDQEIKIIKVDASQSPADAVEAFYTYLKTRQMKAGFELLSDEYLKKTNFEEWTNRFSNVLDVDVFKSEPYKESKDTAYVKFATKTWVDGEVEYRYYEGTWETVHEDGVYKMLKSKIIEVEEPDYNWLYN